MNNLDLQSGYWQIRVKWIRTKLVFVTPRNALATFQRNMDRIKRELHHLNLLVYLDDLVLLSSNHREDLQELRDMLQALAEVR